MRLFRQRFSRVVDQPAVKCLIGSCLVGIVMTCIPLTFIIAEDAKQDFCSKHDCDNSSEADKASQFAWGVSFGLLILLLCVVCSISYTIVGCHTDEQDEEPRNDIERNTGPH